MDALELLKNWPGWQTADAETLFDSPAWRLPVTFGDAPGVLTKADEEVSEPLVVVLSFDDEVCELGLFDSPLFPDLHCLWAKRHDLPLEVLLALIEKECGAVFQMLEDVVKKLVAVKGVIVKATMPATLLSCRRPDGSSFVFQMARSRGVIATFGQFENLDLFHPSIRSLVRPARGLYAALSLEAGDTAALGEGDLLLLPEDETPTWLLSLPEDGILRVCTREEGELAFAEVADEEKPPIPEAEAVAVYRGGRLFARGNVVSLGLGRAVRIVERMN